MAGNGVPLARGAAGEGARRIRESNAREVAGHPSILRVVIQAQMGDLLLAHQVAQRVLELHLLDEQVVLRVELGKGSLGS